MPGGSIFRRRREDQAGAAALCRFEPPCGESREEIRATRTETLLASLPARLPGEKDQVAVHCVYLTSESPIRI